MPSSVSPKFNVDSTGQIQGSIESAQGFERVTVKGRGRLRVTVKGMLRVTVNRCGISVHGTASSRGSSGTPVLVQDASTALFSKTIDSLGLFFWLKSKEKHVHIVIGISAGAQYIHNLQISAKTKLLKLTSLICICEYLP